MLNKQFFQSKKKIGAGVLAIVGSFIIASGWGWYHLDKHIIWSLVLKIFLIGLGVYFLYQTGKWLFILATKYFKRHPFWYEEFVHFLDYIFFFCSLFFIVFFFKTELLSVIYTAVVMALFFIIIHRYLSRHPDAHSWKAVNKTFCLLVYFIFILQLLFQYSAYHYYILDSNIKYFNIVIFRSVAMTSFWLCGFSIGSFVYWHVPRILRRIMLLAWSVFFVVGMFLWTVNIGILYYSGLYFSPTALDHLNGSKHVITTNITFLLIAGLALVALIFALLIRDLFKAHEKTPKRYWYFYNTIIVVGAVVCFLGLSSFKNTPERIVFNSFYNRYFGKEKKVAFPKELQTKLERFGLFYNPDAFAVAHKEEVYSTSTILLPEQFQKQKPNIVIIFLEGFSARLTSVYNDQFSDVTPNFTKMAQDKHTTIFRNYYNASTPTITGTLSQLCSFLPPFGHNEIQNERKLQNHHLLCLPEMLKKYAGYNYAAYITAVDKEFAHKDGIFTSMGVDKIFGTNELKKYIDNEPLSWGYSDHQMFPALSNMMSEQPKDKPFLLMLATVDTHPPFNLSKDELQYGDGSEPVLNTFHTTDDAFGKFWDEFTKSSFYNNTIVVTVADHAIFPAAVTKELFPQEADTLTFYDRNFFMMYVPDSVLPKEVQTLSSGIDFAPTLLHLLEVDKPNGFEGHSIFDDREKYPNLVGMHELGLYINQVVDKNGKRKIDYNVPDNLECNFNQTVSSTAPLTLCEFLNFYKWKRQMFEEGRLWSK